MRRRLIVLSIVVLTWLLWAGNEPVTVKVDDAATAVEANQALTAASDAITLPRLISYQGRLTDTLGVPVPDGNYSLTFRLYTQETGGTPFWSETQTVAVRNGLFSVLLGAVTPIPSVPDEGVLYLGLQVGAGSELTPRLRIASAPYAYLAGRSGDADAVQGKDTSALDARYVNEEQTNAITSAMIQDGTIATADIADNAVTTAKIQDSTIEAADLSQMGAGTGQVLKWTGSAWAPGNDSVGYGDNAWVRGTPPDSVLYTIHRLGIARGGADNMLYGNSRYTHTNLGVACTTGTSGHNYAYCTVGGGHYNTASREDATVGGDENTASGNDATVGGGVDNTASGVAATVGGGLYNTASGIEATVAGGRANTSAGDYSFTTGYHSVVPSSYTNSAAFNAQTATASEQLRCGTLSKTGGSFTIDHPLDPYGKILNHYFIEGPEMVNLYRGSVVLDASGRAEVHLPDYFSALNRNPHIQLTGVGTSEVYVAEKISGNRFVIGGKPGTEVYWLVTGERQDVSAEVTRRMMPIEQKKTGGLAGRMLDDEFLSGCMEQLEREGKAQGIDFRTAAGRQRYLDMKRHMEEMKQKGREK